MTLPPQLLHPLETTGAGEPHPQDDSTGAGEPQPQDDSTGAGELHPHDDSTGAGALQPQETTGAGALHPQDGAGALQVETGALHVETGALQVETGALHVETGALHVGAGVQHEGAGEQLDALPHPPRPARNFANKPAWASEAEATNTEQTTRLATKNRLIGTSLGKQFSFDQKRWPDYLASTRVENAS